MSIRILLADDHEAMRDALYNLLCRMPEVEPAGTVGDGRAAVETVGRIIPDLVIMDINMPVMNGIEATRKVKRIIPDIKVLCISICQSEQLVRDALAAGASGYLLKEFAFFELPAAIRAVWRGECYLSFALTQYSHRNNSSS